MLIILIFSLSKQNIITPEYILETAHIDSIQTKYLRSEPRVQLIQNKT